jgi:hypothetical protein
MMRKLLNLRRKAPGESGSASRLAEPEGVVRASAEVVTRNWALFFERRAALKSLTANS